MPVVWSTTSNPSACRAGSASASRATIAASMLAAFAVAAFGRTRGSSRFAARDGAAAGAVDARGGPGEEDRIGSQDEDILDAGGDVVGDLGHGTDPAQVGLGSSRGRKPERPVV